MKKPPKWLLDEASRYQYVLDGETFKLNEMDRGQLMRALMRTIDMVQDTQEAIDEASRQIGSWQEEG